MNDIKDLEVLVAVRTPLIVMETVDLERVQSLSEQLASKLHRPLYVWSLARGLVNSKQAQAPRRSLSAPLEVLAHIASLTSPALYLMLDLHRYLDDPPVVSLLRRIAALAGEVHHSLILVAPVVEIPAELRAVAVRFVPALPDSTELRALINEVAAEWAAQSGRRLEAPAPLAAALIRNLSGLSLVEARRLVRNAIFDDGVLSDSDLPRLMDAKYRLLDQGSALSFELDVAEPQELAGLRRLKRWLAQRQRVFQASSPPPGLDTPKGLLLLGVQGGGKSLAAKAVAGAWQLPLLRMDFGALYDKYYGETERNLRAALQTAALMAPCVLWIDEIEKGLTAGNDEGPSRRLLGTLLTWMAERKDRVFLVATANDISVLPPELLRKGRFDEIFFIDLPSAEVREEIFRIHLRKREQDLDRHDCAALAAQAEGFTGAEIEQAVVSALYSAYGDSAELSTAHIAQELQQTRPLSLLMAEKVQALRQWAADRTVPAD